MGGGAGIFGSWREWDRGLSAGRGCGDDACAFHRRVESQFFSACGIRQWLVTGDQVMTAVNVCRACGLLGEGDWLRRVEVR